MKVPKWLQEVVDEVSSDEFRTRMTERAPQRKTERVKQTKPKRAEQQPPTRAQQKQLKQAARLRKRLRDLELAEMELAEELKAISEAATQGKNVRYRLARAEQRKRQLSGR